MAKSVQDFIPIEEIRDGVAILKGGEMRTILLASSVNFDLKSVDEQEAIIMQYQNFLNSLDFPIQFFVQSRKLDIKPYLNLLDSQLREQTNELIKVQTREYINFIGNVAEQSNIMAKAFFIVVPYSPSILSENKSGGLLGSLLPNSGKSKKQDKLEKFEEHRSQLEQRRSIVMQGLARIGIRTFTLGTEEMVELFYKIFNPGDVNVPTVANN